MDAATFRSDLPEFANATRFPDSRINFWLGIGNKLLNAQRWADLLDHGLELFVAHHLTLAKQNEAAAATGGVPGVSTGAVSAKEVDKVSVSYDTSAGLEENAGHWNLTTYGTQLIRLARMVGSGGMQF